MFRSADYFVGHDILTYLKELYSLNGICDKIQNKNKSERIKYYVSKVESSFSLRVSVKSQGAIEMPTI